MMMTTTTSPPPTTSKPPTTNFLFLFYTFFLLLLLLIMASSSFFIQQQGFSTHELVTLRPRRQRVVSTDSSTSLKGLHFQGVRKGWKSRNSRRLMIGSTAPSCTYNECRGCKFRCRAEQIPVDANDPINSAYHYRCVCHR